MSGHWGFPYVYDDAGCSKTEFNHYNLGLQRNISTHRYSEWVFKTDYFQIGLTGFFVFKQKAKTNLLENFFFKLPEEFELKKQGGDDNQKYLIDREND